MRAWPLALAHIRTHLGYVAGLHLAIAIWGFTDGCKKAIEIGYKKKNLTYKPFKSLNPCWFKASGLLKVEDKKNFLISMDSYSGVLGLETHWHPMG